MMITEMCGDPISRMHASRGLQEHAIARHGEKDPWRRQDHDIHESENREHRRDGDEGRASRPYEPRRRVRCDRTARGETIPT